jgi:hypothetical protein
MPWSCSELIFHQLSRSRALVLFHDAAHGSRSLRASNTPNILKIVETWFNAMVPIAPGSPCPSSWLDICQKFPNFQITADKLPVCAFTRLLGKTPHAWLQRSTCHVLPKMTFNDFSTCNIGEQETMSKHGVDVDLLPSQLIHPHAPCGTIHKRQLQPFGRHYNSHRNAVYHSSKLMLQKLQRTSSRTPKRITLLRERKKSAGPERSAFRYRGKYQTTLPNLSSMECRRSVKPVPTRRQYGIHCDASTTGLLR